MTRPMPTTDAPAGSAGRRPWQDASLAVDTRVQLLMDAMTITEKVAQLGSYWDDKRNSTEIIAPMQDVLSAGRPTFESVTEHGIGHLTRVLGTTPAPAATGAERLANAQRSVVSRSRLGIPAIAHEECLTGFTTLGATVYPTALAWAATFDPALVREMAATIGRDMHATGVHQGLAPVLDVVRDYRWGRVEETMGEDPYLVSVIGTAYVAGMTGAGVIATLKHFAGYAASAGGRNHAPVSIGERELHDVVLPPFEMAVRLGGAQSVMNAYTELDRVPSAADRSLLTTLLRDEWGFTGTVVSDYWAVAFLKSKHGVAATMPAAGVLALRAGMDVELPDTAAFGALDAAVESGLLDVSDVDTALRRVLTQKTRLGLLDADWSAEPPVPPADIDLDSAGNRALARRVAEESVILLANPSGLLPLAEDSRRIAIIGPGATDVRSFLGCYSYPIHVLPRHPELGLGLPIQSIPEALSVCLPGSTITTAEGCDITGTRRDGLEEASELAAAADLVIAVVGDRAGMFGRGTSGEGCDAPDLTLPGIQDELLTRLLDTGTPVVVIVVSGRPYALGRHADRTAAILQSFMPGVEGAAALAAVLTGATNPSGKLPVQIPATTAALPHTYLAPPLGQDGDRISNLSIAPLFPFGHGLSYTSFDVSPVTVSADEIRTAGSLTASATVTNTGGTAGSTVVQLYFSDPVAEVTRPVIQLLGFAKVALDPGHSATVSFGIHTDRFAFMGLDKTRIVEPGEIRLRAGLSSADLGDAVSIDLVGPRRVVGRHRVLATDVVVVPSV